MAMHSRVWSRRGCGCCAGWSRCRASRRNGQNVAPRSSLSLTTATVPEIGARGARNPCRRRWRAPERAAWVRRGGGSALAGSGWGAQEAVRAARTRAEEVHQSRSLVQPGTGHARCTPSRGVWEADFAAFRAVRRPPRRFPCGNTRCSLRRDRLVRRAARGRRARRTRREEGLHAEDELPCPHRPSSLPERAIARHPPRPPPATGPAPSANPKSSMVNPPYPEWRIRQASFLD
jgi:hypothetical protein